MRHSERMKTSLAREFTTRNVQSFVFRFSFFIVLGTISVTEPGAMAFLAPRNYERNIILPSSLVRVMPAACGCKDELCYARPSFLYQDDMNTIRNTDNAYLMIRHSRPQHIALEAKDHVSLKKDQIGHEIIHI